MLLYYERYERSNLPGVEGFRFVGGRWPGGISPDMEDPKGAGFLWSLISSIYGDRSADLTLPESRFFLRGCFGALNATVAGIASVCRDAQGRIGTCANLVLCLPQSEQEARMELEPEFLFQELGRPHQPGTQAARSPEQLRRCRVGASVPRKEYMPLVRPMVCSSCKMVIFDAEPENRLARYAMEICAMLPVARRRRFSFLTYATNWSELYEREVFDFLGAKSSPENQQRIRAMEQTSGSRVFFMDWVQQNSHLPGLSREPGAAYLQRIYPILLRNGEQDLPAACGQWFARSEFAKGLRLQGRSLADAAGLMLRAAKSSRKSYYPLREEKAEVRQALSV